MVDQTEGKEEIKEKQKCKVCGSDALIEDSTRGERICTNCGAVLETIISTEPEWRAFTQSERESRERVGAPLTNLRIDKGLRTNIGSGYRDITGRSLKPSTISTMRRLRWLNRRTGRSEARNLRKAISELKRIASQLSISDDINETAAMYYRKALKAKLIRGRSINSMTAAAIYIACRTHNVPKTLKDVCTVAKVDRKELARCVRVYIVELGIKPKPINPAQLVSRLATELELTMHTQKRAIEILKKVRDHKLDVGKNPMSVAAAVLYIAGIQTGERRTQQQVAQAAKTTPVTLRNRFKEIVAMLEIGEVVVKRGAAATPVYVRDPYKF
ncbi:MAG: transcription initiation factor IIB [Candidatus Heimdallarchaeota archaeon]|nr:transcription initiation factor IIB [Candidatus Heimdallarchaeota archaeon]